MSPHSRLISLTTLSREQLNDIIDKLPLEQSSPCCSIQTTNYHTGQTKTSRNEWLKDF